MARELGMNPRKFGGLDNGNQERWKTPLPEFIEHLYERRFGREAPEVVMSIEDMIKREQQRKDTKKRRKALRQQEQPLKA
jgi:hypothetical protein